MVEDLLALGAEIECVSEYDAEKDGGDTILHMLVRQSELGAPEDSVQWVKEMFDIILKKIHEKNKSDQNTQPYNKLNKAGWSPLMLAAAVGSTDIFDHVLKVYARRVNWAFGPYRGVTLEIQESKIDFTRSGHSVLSLILHYSRKDRIGNSDIKELLDTKWNKYAK